MKLFLASSIKHPDSTDSLDKFVNGLAGKKIAFIPTAANGEEGFGIWKNGGSFKAVTSLKADVEVVELENYRNDSVLKVLEKKDIIWMHGGYWGYLMYWLRHCDVDINIKSLLDKGVVYVGNSAGANVCSRTLEIARIFHDGGEPKASIFPGLGLIDFDIYPHYEDNLYDYIKSVYKGNKIYLLKDGESIAIDGNDIKIFGKERIITN